MAGEGLDLKSVADDRAQPAYKMLSKRFEAPDGAVIKSSCSDPESWQAAQKMQGHKLQVLTKSQRPAPKNKKNKR
jgi:hypothetical protein